MRVDTVGMARITTIQWLKPLEEAIEVVTVPADGRIPRNEVFVVDVFGGRPVPVELGDTRNQYLIVFGWTPDSRRVILGRYDRLLTRVDIILVDAPTGAWLPEHGPWRARDDRGEQRAADGGLFHRALEAVADADRVGRVRCHQDAPSIHFDA